MSERMPKLISANRSFYPDRVTLYFDALLTIEHTAELTDLLRLEFAGQLRRDPDAPQTAPPPPEAGT